MMVFIVTSGIYDDFTVRGVFDSLEKAIKYGEELAANKNKWLKREDISIIPEMMNDPNAETGYWINLPDRKEKEEE